MGALASEEVLSIEGAGNFFKDVFKPIAIIEAGIFGGSGGAASAIIALYCLEELHHSNVGNAWADFHRPDNQMLAQVINNPYNYVD